MPLRRTPLRRIARPLSGPLLLLAAGVLVAGCGDGNSAIASLIADGDEDRVAEALLLDDRVLDGAWVAVDREESDPDNDAMMRDIAEDLSACNPLIESGALDDGDLEITEPADHRAESPTYTRDRDEVEFTASVYDSVEEAAATFLVVENLDVNECFGALMPAAIQASIDEQGSDLALEARVSDPVAPSADDTWLFVLDIDLTSGGQDAGTLHYELHAARMDRAVIGTTIVTYQPIDSASVRQSAIDRLTEVLEG